MTREAGVAYKSRKYGLCTLKAVCTNLAKKFTAAVLLDANKYICPQQKHEDLVWGDKRCPCLWQSLFHGPSGGAATRSIQGWPTNQGQHLIAEILSLGPIVVNFQGEVMFR